jgi:hypothetical protein
MPVDLVSVELPANTAVPMPAISYVSRRQLIWVIEGTLTFEAGSSTYEMAAGDCLELGDPADCVFRNKTTQGCRYAVIVLRPA